MGSFPVVHNTPQDKQPDRPNPGRPDGNDIRNVRLPQLPERERSQFTQEDKERVVGFVRDIGVDFRFTIVNALFSQILMPGVATLLEKAGGVKSDPLSRYKLTRLFFLNMVSQPEGQRARQALAQVKRVHQAVGVRTDLEDFNYVLYTLSHKILDSLEHYDLKAPSKELRQSWFKLWRNVGLELGSSGIPVDEQQFVKDMQALERKHLQSVSPQSKSVAKSTLEDAAGVFPPPLRPLAMRIVYALVDPELARGLELPQVPELDRKIIRRLLQTSSEASRVWRTLWGQLRGGHPGAGPSWKPDEP